MQAAMISNQQRNQSQSVRKRNSPRTSPKTSRENPGRATGVGWHLIKNETERGENPYTGGYEEVTSDLVSKRRNIPKERKISPVPFSSF